MSSSSQALCCTPPYQSLPFLRWGDQMYPHYSRGSPSGYFIIPRTIRPGHWEAEIPVHKVGLRCRLWERICPGRSSRAACGKFETVDRRGNPNEAEIGRLTRLRRHIFGANFQERFQVRCHNLVPIKGGAGPPVAGKSILIWN